jgi:hypothetical protein
MYTLFLEHTPSPAHFFWEQNRNMPVTLNIPVEVSAGTYPTNVTVQGEAVSYNYFHIPVKYATISGDMVAADLGTMFQYKEDSNHSQILVDVSGSTSALQSLVQTALTSSGLVPVSVSGVSYADNTSRNLSTDPLKYYVSASEHVTASDISGATLEAYVKEYLYDNLSAVLGLSATTGSLSVTLDQSATIAGTVVTKLTETTVNGSAIRQNMYEQLFQLAPERFSAGEDNVFQPLPFEAGDAITFLISYQFPSSMISTPVYQNAMRVNGSSLYVGTGNKILVQTGTTTPVLQNFPDCTVLMRIVLTN